MDTKNLVLIFFIIIIALTLLSFIPSNNQTGHMIMPSIVSIDIAIMIIIFSLFTIAVVLSTKSYYPF